jgi:Tol biopolymer transport system component
VRAVLLCAFVLLPASAATVSAAHAATLERVSVSTSGAFADRTSEQSAISQDGRFVAFSSAASNLVAGDAPMSTDVFVRDRRQRTTTRVSIPRSGGGSSCPADDLSGPICATQPAISADGRHVAFASFSDDLVAGDTNGVGDVFVHDLETGTTSRVSISSTGAEGNGYSGNQSLRDIAISADGRFVAFSSSASNLVPRDSNGLPDVFVHDRNARRTMRVSVGAHGAQARPQEIGGVAISGSGRLVAFTSSAPALVAHDANDTVDVFVRDTRRKTTTRVNLGRRNREANGDSDDAPSISLDGRFVAFSSTATNLVRGDRNRSRDVFVRDRRRRVTRRVSVSSRGREVRCVDRDEDPRRSSCSQHASIAPSGRRVAFTSLAPGLLPRDGNDGPDYFVHDLRSGRTRRVNVSAAVPEQSLDATDLEFPAMANRFVAFSTGSELLESQPPWRYDIFVRAIVR